LNFITTPFALVTALTERQHCILYYIRVEGQSDSMLLDIPDSHFFAVIPRKEGVEMKVF
jgi:hypothetical protein